MFYSLKKYGKSPFHAEPIQDEHWKTANSALERIRKGFGKRKKRPQTFFIGAAIENSMASEIFKQIQSGSLDNAANLTNDDQLTSICEWIVNL